MAVIDPRTGEIIKGNVTLGSLRVRQDYLIATGLDDCVFKPAAGSERAGRDLLSLVEDARVIRGILNNLHSRYNRKVVEQAAIAGMLTPAVHGDLPKALAAAQYIAVRLDALSEETERGWQFLAPYLAHVRAAVFSRQAYVPKLLQSTPTAIVAPSISRANGTLEPTALMCVPGEIHSRWMTGSRELVAVTMMSAPRTASSAVAVIRAPAIFSAFARERLNTRISRMFRTSGIAVA